MIKIREEWVDLSKGIAIFLVVLGHVLGIYMVANLYIEQQYFIRYIHFTIYNFHMPLYFILSGYLYCKVEKNRDFTDYKGLLLKKIIGLGIPYIIFSLIQGMVQVLLSQYTHNKIGFSSLLNIATQPILQFWFIYTLLFIFIIVPFMDILIKNDKLKFLLLIVCKITSFFITTNIIAIDTFLQYSVYFYCGKMLFTYCKSILKNKMVLIIASIIYIILNISCYFYLDNIYEEYNNILDVILAISGSILVVYVVTYFIQKTKIIKKCIALLGKYSFEIYIFHIMFAYGTKTILSKLGIGNLFINLFLDTSVGIIVPIMIGCIAKKIPFMYYMIFPNKFFKDRKKLKLMQN
jgi:fucose 4-O-acetylase-like acetyltransferase